MSRESFLQPRPQVSEAPHGKGGGRHRSPRVQPSSTPDGKPIIGRGAFIAGALALGALTVVGALTQSNSHPSEKQTISPTLVPDAPKPAEQEFSGETKETIDILTTMNTQSRKEPKTLEGFLPFIKGLAVAFFSKEMGYDKKMFDNRVEFVKDQVFVERLLRCAKERKRGDNFAATGLTDKKTYLNKDAFLDAAQKGTIGAYETFVLVLHELHHLAPPLRESNIIFNDTKVVYVRGVKLWAQSNSNPAADCYIGDSDELEEAIVQDSTMRMLERLGIIFTPLALEEDVMYLKQVNAYRQKILPYFDSYKELLQYHQRSDPVGLYREIGIRRGVVNQADQFNAGYNFVYETLPEINRG